MIAGKHIDKICAIITIVAVLVTTLFMNGQALGIVADDSVSMEYADTLFDDSYVHTIDISIDDWDELIANATAEEYTNADVTIDGETVKNVGIRAKGNTSLSTVSQLGSQRYSLKIEFDCYEATGNYKGLDKLCLNNLIQDYTMMKDYIAYKLMNAFGVAAPLVSYCYITVNGEDWGLYLAVEAVEDSFLQRNYGKNYGQLYKPDSMSFGAGRGKGGDFDMRNMDFDKMGMDNPFERGNKDGDSVSGNEVSEGGNTDSKGSDGSDSGSENGGGMPDFPGGEMQMPSFDGENMPNFEGGEMPQFDGENMPDFGNKDGQSSEDASDSSSDGSEGKERPSFDGGMRPDFKGGFPGGGQGGPGGGGFPGMGSDDVKLKYSDDDTDSYSTIFNNAKTNAQPSDQKRLIKSLKALSEGVENGDESSIDSAVDTDAVMRYMVVHNFLVNGDSYTGNMIHNYYLYEEDGEMAMIPWDYNLAFGTFQGQDATGTINDPIDTPLSVTDDDTDRPMFAWITSTEGYTEAYHELYEDFLEQFYTSGYLTELVDNTYEMIKDYVEKDPTKFCTSEEFEKGVETIRSFVTLRCESIQGQLDGTIPTTDAGQKENSDNLVDASDLTLSDMGSMGGGGQGGPGGGGFGGFPGGGFSQPGSENTDAADATDAGNTE